MNTNSLIKKVMSLFLVTAIFVSVPATAFATTVYYQGDPVNWDYGRAKGLFSFSKVQTHKYDHCATANSVFSGWKFKGVLAEASDYIGTGTARCYWNCR